MKLIEFE
jgi:hypothetical protein